MRKDLGIGEFDFPRSKFPPLRTAREVNAAVHGEEDSFFSLPFISVEDAVGDLPPLEAGQDAIAYGKPPFSDYQASRRKGARILTNHSAREHDEEFVEKKLKKIPEGGSNQDLDGRSRFDRGREIKYLSQAYLGTRLAAGHQGQAERSGPAPADSECAWLLNNSAALAGLEFFLMTQPTFETVGYYRSALLASNSCQFVKSVSGLCVSASLR